MSNPNWKGRKRPYANDSLEQYSQDEAMTLESYRRREAEPRPVKVRRRAMGQGPK